MASYTVRNMELHELQDIYVRIVSDFASGEYPPYNILYEHLEKGTQQGLIMLRDGMDVAYSICAHDAECSYVLVSLLAVYKGFRGQGIGTIFLEKIKEIFSRSNGIIVEVEKPENAETISQRGIRDKRIDFYKKSGFKIVLGIDYSIWDIPLHLMVYQSEDININDIESAMHEIYLSLMGKRFIHKMKFNIK